MQEDKELFSFLGVEKDSAAARNIDALDRAVNRHINMSAGPSKETLANIMLAASKKNRFAIKNMFSAFRYKTLLTGALAFMLVIGGTSFWQRSAQVAETEIYSSAVESDFELLDADLEEILAGLNNIENLSFMEENV